MHEIANYSYFIGTPHVLDNAYIELNDRLIHGQRVIGFIKKKEKEKAQQAFKFLLDELIDGETEKDIRAIVQKTQQKFDISVTLEECREKFSPSAKPTFKVYVGKKEVDSQRVGDSKTKHKADTRKKGAHRKNHAKRRSH